MRHPKKDPFHKRYIDQVTQCRTIIMNWFANLFIITRNLFFPQKEEYCNKLKRKQIDSPSFFNFNCQDHHLSRSSPEGSADSHQATAQKNLMNQQQAACGVQARPHPIHIKEYSTHDVFMAFNFLLGKMEFCRWMRGNLKIQNLASWACYVRHFLNCEIVFIFFWMR